MALESLDSSLGPVSDLSAGGMRVFSRRRPRRDKVFAVTLIDRDEVVEVKAKVVWSRKIAFTRYELGVEFVDLDEATSRTLTQMAMANRQRRAG